MCTIWQSEAGDKLPLVETIYLCRRAIVGDDKEQNPWFYIVSITVANHVLRCKDPVQYKDWEFHIIPHGTERWGGTLISGPTKLKSDS
jgi:hypothetical protein